MTKSETERLQIHEMIFKRAKIPYKFESASDQLQHRTLSPHEATTWTMTSHQTASNADKPEDMEVNPPHDPTEESNCPKMSDVGNTEATAAAAKNEADKRSESPQGAEETDKSSADKGGIPQEETSEKEPGFFRKKRQDMTPEELEEEKTRRRDYKQRRKAEDKAAGKFTEKSKFPYVIRYPDTKNHKITLNIYRKMVRDLGARNVLSIVSAGRRGETVVVSESALETSRWIQTGDRAEAKKLEAYQRRGHLFLGFQEEAAMNHFTALLKETIEALQVKPIVIQNDDPRAVFTVSLITDLWEALGKTDPERRFTFLEVLSYNEAQEFPMEGSQVVGSFLKPSDSDFTILIIRASETWATAARRTPTRQSGVGLLRFFERPPKDVQKEANGANHIAEQLAHMSTGQEGQSSKSEFHSANSDATVKEGKSYADAATDKDKKQVPKADNHRRGSNPYGDESDIVDILGIGKSPTKPPAAAAIVKKNNKGQKKSTTAPQAALNRAPPIVVPNPGPLDKWVRKDRSRKDSDKTTTSTTTTSSSSSKRHASSSPGVERRDAKEADKKSTPK